MTRSRINRAFARYRSSGDPRALARVFDLTSTELLRVAVHLSGDRHAAEDLVQQTFLVAIEHRDRFDGDCDVLPWLCGILANRVRELRRRAQGPGPAHRADATPDPADEAAASELRRATHAAIRTLPEPYRRVLIMHLEHDLGGREIAEADGCSPSTVRSQIHRGLDLLRKALPAAFGAAGVVVKKSWFALAVTAALALVAGWVLLHELLPDRSLVDAPDEISANTTSAATGTDAAVDAERPADRVSLRTEDCKLSVPARSAHSHRAG